MFIIQFDPSNDGHINGTFENAEKKIAIHTKIMEEYLKKINSSHETEQSINWVTHQKCHDMFVLSKVISNNYLKCNQKKEVGKIKLERKWLSNFIAGINENISL